VHDFSKAIECNYDDYFNTMRQGIIDYRHEIIKYFQDYQITREFERMTRAPDSVDKQMMVTTERGNLEGLDEAFALIRQGGQYYNKYWLSGRHFFTDLTNIVNESKEPNTFFEFSSHNKNQILKKLGFSKHPDLRCIKIDGTACNMFVAKKFTKEELMSEVKNASPPPPF
jgi:hypothetical protein